MQRLSFEETWKLLRETTNIVGQEDFPPDKLSPASFNRTPPSNWVDYYKSPDIYDNGEEDPWVDRDIWKLENLTMPRIFLCRCGVYQISFRNTSLIESFLCWNDFIDVDFTDADLSRCDMRCSTFENDSFIRADLREADLRMSTFKTCDFTDANMSGTKLTRSQAKGLALSEEQLQDIAWKSRNGKEPQGG